MDPDLAPLVIAVGEDEVVVAAQRACKHRLRNEKTGEGGKIFQHVASIAMSVVLARVNAFVSVETKNLLIGEAASNEMATGVRKLIEAEAAQSSYPPHARHPHYASGSQRCVSTFASSSSPPPPRTRPGRVDLRCRGGRGSERGCRAHRFR